MQASSALDRQMKIIIYIPGCKYQREATSIFQSHLHPNKLSTAISISEFREMKLVKVYHNKQTKTEKKKVNKIFLAKIRGT